MPSFAPQGGLRISARDLAKIGRLLLNGGKVDRVRLISAKSLNEMLRPAWSFNGTNGLTFETDTGDAGGALYCRYGPTTQALATKLPGCKDDPWGDGVAAGAQPQKACGQQINGFLVRVPWLVGDRNSGDGFKFVDGKRSDGKRLSC